MVNTNKLIKSIETIQSEMRFEMYNDFQPHVQLACVVVSKGDKSRIVYSQCEYGDGDGIAACREALPDMQMLASMNGEVAEVKLYQFTPKELSDFEVLLLDEDD